MHVYKNGGGFEVTPMALSKVSDHQEQRPAFSSRVEASTPKTDNLPFEQKYKKTCAFVKGMAFGTGMALTAFHLNMFVIEVGAACGVVNAIRAAWSTEESLKKWNAAQKTALFGGIGTYIISEYHLGWFGIGFVAVGAASLIAQSMKRKK